MEKDDVEVAIEPGMLTISGERHVEQEDDDEAKHRIERMYGRFSRRFTLPADADAASITATSKNGVLKVTVPKVEESADSAVRIAIK